MKKEIELFKNLRKRLDDIDNEIRQAVSDPIYESKLKIEIGMWEKGNAIDVEFRGVKSTPSYRELEKHVGRTDDSLKTWHNLYQKYPDKQKYISEYAEPKARAWTDKLLNPPAIKPLETSPLPSGKYRVIYADPPWQFSNNGLGGSAEKHYGTLSVQEIFDYKDKKERKIQDLIDENAVLFLWVPNAFLREGLQVCGGWGFEYKTNWVWIKQKSAYGKLAFYNYGQHEFLFIGTQGSSLPAEGSLIPSIIYAEKTKHSEKPEIVYGIIEKMYSGPYVEGFARKKRLGWDFWGDEII